MKSLISQNLTLSKKICLTGLFIALAIILQKVIAINNIAIVPFLRISIGGPAIIIFSSIYLGPIFGMLVGGCSDFLGYLIFDPKSFGFFPQITLIYIALGFFSYFIFLFINKIKNRKIIISLEIIFLLIFFVSVSSYLLINNEMNLYGTVYCFEEWQKYLIIAILFVLSIFVMLFTLLFSKKVKDDNLKISVFNISFSLFIIEIVIMLLFGTLMKGLAFGFETYLAILICQIISLFVNIPLNTVIIILMNKYIK